MMGLGDFLFMCVLVFMTIVFLVTRAAKAYCKQEQNKSNAPQYQPAGPLFTAAERSFYGALSMAVGDKAKIFGKVRIADVIKPRGKLSKQAWYHAFNKVSGKHFDFVLCKKEDLSVLCTIELDDKSHDTPKRIERDIFVDSACASAGITLHRFKAKRTYNPKEIEGRIFGKPSEFLGPDVTTALSASSDDNVIPLKTDPPMSDAICPMCFSGLDKKISEYGTNKGKTIFVCKTFPECKYIKVS